MGIRLKRFVWILGIVAFALGAHGVFELLDESIPLTSRLAESFYSSIQFFTISHPDYLIFTAEGDQNLYRMNWTLQLARYLAPLVTLTAAISFFSSVIDNWLRQLRVKLFYRRHVVIFGFNLRSRMLCEDLVRRGKRVVLIEPNLETVDHAWLRKRGVIAFKMSEYDSVTAERCKVERANYVFAMQTKDAKNLKILVSVYQRNKAVFGGPESDEKATQAPGIDTRCFVHFSETNYKHLKFGSQFTDLDNYFSLQVFSVYSHSARLLTSRIYKRYATELLGGKRLQIILFGTGRTGQAILEQLVRMSFFRKNKSATITVIDDNEAGWKRIESRFPILTLQGEFYREEEANRIRCLKDQIGFPKTEFNEVPFDSASLLTGRAFESKSADSEVVTLAILSSADATKNLTIADALLQQQKVEFQEIFVRSDENDPEIRSYVRSELDRKNLSGFPTLDEICKLSVLDEGSIELLARTIHEEYLKELGNLSNSHPSLTSWTKLDESYKESNRRAALHIEIKCALLGLEHLNLEDYRAVKKAASEIKQRLKCDERDAYLELLAECEHSRWCIEKLLDGWTPGTVRNDSVKAHPNLVPWEMEDSSIRELFSGFAPLTENDKQKDRNNIEKIPILLDNLASRLKN